MGVDGFRLAEHVHGHLGWLAAAILLHPAIALRNRARDAHLAVGLATGFVTVAATLGAALYPSYRGHLKARIFADSPALGLVFERKEHLAFAAVLLAWAGAAAYAAARKATPDTRVRLRTIAFRAFVASAVLAVLAAVMGTAVASFRSF